MLKQRVITASILLVVCGVVIFYASPKIFAATSWLLCLIAIYELLKMYQFSITQTILTTLFLTFVAISLSLINYDVSQIIRIASVIAWCFIVPLTLIFTPSKFTKSIIVFFAILIFIPAYYALSVLHALFGPWQLLSIMAIAWVSDTGAYFVGKQFGRHKLAKKISPGKSIEGAIGGFVLVGIYLSILHYYNLAYYLPTYSQVFKFAFILTWVGIVGDLIESWFKRVANVKDSGDILPGHGGVFDRIDSMIAILAISFAIIRGMI